ncbi:uncharacterized transposon-derived [Paramuricea clavata]|uniref:Uncharacterized transposon-derived n=1 Tax=Paramuricea clavata TaxID=317549 RepID=A0A7D9HCS2_PARCT|nr:uncharacterized transposon-derived [Paramuricea clavata]
MTKAVDLSLEEFKKRFGQYPEVAQFDEGKEFYNVAVKNLLGRHDVRYFSTNSDRKSAIVERFNRTLKTMMCNKGYEANFTEEIFKVLSVFRGDPNMYEIESHDGEPIIGKFYEEELSVVDKKNYMYRVEKILRRRKVVDGSRPDGSTPNIRRDVGIMKRSYTLDKKDLLKRELEVNINKGDGPSSTIIFDKMKLTVNRAGTKINGATFKDVKIIILKNLKMIYSTDKSKESAVNEYKELIRKAKIEHSKTPAAAVEERLEQQNLDAPQEL